MSGRARLVLGGVYVLAALVGVWAGDALYSALT